MIEKELEIQEEEWGLHLVVKEGVEVNNLNVLERVEPIIKMAKEKGKNRILVEAYSARRNVSIIRLFQVGELLFKLRTAGIRVAFVAPQYVGSKESKFMENVASNRGSYVRYFSGFDEALNWLLS